MTDFPTMVDVTDSSNPPTGAVKTNAAYYNFLHIAIKGLETGARPSWAFNRTKRWESRLSVYNLRADNTRHVRAALASAAAGLSLCRLGWVGDSVTAGYTGVPGTDDPVTRLSRIISNSVIPSGFIAPLYNAGALDTRVTTNDSAFPGVANRPLTQVAAGKTLTFTGSGTTFEALIANASTSVTYKVDGGAAVTFVASTTTTYFTKLVVSGLTEGSHTVVFTVGSGGSLYAYAGGFRRATGITVHNAAISGTTSPGWLVNDGPGLYGMAWTFYNAEAFGYDGVFIELGGNDALQTLSTTSLTTNLRTLIQRARGINADPILSLTHNVLGTSAAWNAYAAAVYDAADAEDVPLIDFYDTFGALSDRIANGQDGGDNLHLSAKGNALRAQRYADTLLPRAAA